MIHLSDCITQKLPDLRFFEVSNIACAYLATSIIEALAVSCESCPILRGPADPSLGTPVLCPYLTNVNFQVVLIL